ncbi:hypothetical protein BV898_17324 [Hypsibius exemplaris]|uniref:Uncharacterized protein n=1 Tax=Hypsibius exemplaris TaxID=2072580 RepID=A0A9X6RMG7_HYPEX|nr:hypothetical protein BV898_17324 [Hypsibius exemplaris]
MLLEHMLTIWLTISCLISGIVSLDNPNSKCISQMAQECTTDQECIDACASERLGEGKCGKFRASTFLCYCNGCEQINTLVFPSEKKSSNLSTTNQHLCGGTNYDPTVSVCLKGKTICSIGELACRNATTATCYDPSEKTCFAGLLCPNNQTFCGILASIPASSCTRGSIICAGYCYDPHKVSLLPQQCFLNWLHRLSLGPDFMREGLYDPVEKTCINAVFFLYALFISSGDPNNHTNPILMGMQFMPFCTLNFRGLIVLFLLFLKRNSWTKLMKTAEVFLETCFPNNQDRTAVMRRARKIAVLLCLLTVSMHSAWDVSEWIVTTETLVNVTMTYGDIATPLPMAYLMYQYISVWTVFCTFPFVLSQQVYICVIVLAVILTEAVKSINQQIKQEIVLYEGRFAGKNELAMTEEKIIVWENAHLRVLLFCRCVNHYFSWILFIIYGLDFLTMMGYSANVIKNPRTDADSYVYIIGSIIIFGSYGTVFLLPFVHVYEQSLGLSFSLHHLAIAVKQCLAVTDKTDGQSNLNRCAFKGKTLIESVERLETSTNRHICIFHAVELIHYTRGFVVGTCTLLLSFMVLAREFFAKDQEAAVSAGEKLENVSH